MGMFFSAVEPRFARDAGHERAPAAGGAGDPGNRAKLPHLRKPDNGNRSPSGEGQAARQRSALADLLAPCGRSSAATRADQLLRTFGSLGRVFAASKEALDQATGVPGTGSIVAAAREAYQEALCEAIHGSRVDSADPRLHRYLAARLGTMAEEHTYAIFIDARGQYITDETVAAGGSAAVPVRCRALFQRALALEARAILLAHNHPSGEAVASPSDVSVTRELVQIAKRLELTIVDHLIVTSREVFSMKRAGLL